MTLLPRPAAAAYDPRNPPRTENFDPQEANPEGRLFCQGYPQINLPTLSVNFNPNEKTLQQLCVKPQYGGGSRHQHLGGFCADGLVIFDPSHGAMTSYVLFNTRMLLQCLLRCYCYNYDPDSQAGPAEGHDNDHSEIGNPYVIKADLIDDFGTPLSGNRGGLVDPSWHIEVITAVEVPLRHLESQGLEIDQIDLRLSHSGLWDSKETILDPANTVIFCDGPLPSWRFPPPVGIDQFTGVLEQEITPLEQLCFNSLDGGNADELMPRWDWTFGGNQILHAIALRTHCYRFCGCNILRTTSTSVSSVPSKPTDDPTTVTSKKRKYPFEPDYVVEIPDDGSMVLKRRSDGQELAPALSPQQSTNQRNAAAGPCGPEGMDFCPGPWKDEWGENPLDWARKRKKPGQGTGVLGGSGAGKKPLTACGSRCKTMRDCAPAPVPASAGRGCFCASPGPSIARALGLDPLFPPPVCLVGTVSGLPWPGGRRRARRDLRGGGETSGLVAEGSGRAEEEEEDQAQVVLNGEGEVMECLCNETYSGPGCCWVRDGLVWV
ncbi:MAG: hypothetical protein Q9167_004459 [Letrouitia subvulpina]